MEKLKEFNCRKCGGDTSIRWRESTEMDIEPAGMRRICHVCGYNESIHDLETKPHPKG